MNSWSSNLGNELVVYAIDIVAKNNAINWNYIDHTLMD
ncbi:DnaD domain protein [Clostridium botulinum]